MGCLLLGLMSNQVCGWPKLAIDFELPPKAGNVSPALLYRRFADNWRKSTISAEFSADRAPVSRKFSADQCSDELFGRDFRIHSVGWRVCKISAKTLLIGQPYGITKRGWFVSFC